jgi:tight adherence protein F
VHNFSSEQRGNFTVEFAIVGVIFALLLVFSGDLIVKLSVKGKLDRMAFSAVSVLKERTELFDKQPSNDKEALGDKYTLDDNTFDVTDKQALDTYRIVEHAMQRTMGHFDSRRFGFVLDVRRGNYVKHWTPTTGIYCQSIMPARNLSFTTIWGRPATIYQISLCYRTDNGFGALIGQNFRQVSSRAVMIGR